MQTETRRAARRRLHRIALTGGALVALAAPNAASARATAQVDVVQGPTAGQTFNVCTGETAPATGHSVLVNREVIDGVGGRHFASIGTRVLRSEDAVTINHQADPGPSNFNTNGATNVTDVIQIKTVSRGSEDNAFDHTNHTTVITPNGDVTTNGNSSQGCQG
jgi:hypothetical protein